MVQPVTTSPPRQRLWVDLTIFAVIGVLLFAALGAAGAVLYKEFYGPSAFVTRYLDLLATGRAADALRVPGVGVDREMLEESGIGITASEALLRQTVLAPLTDIEVVSEETTNNVTSVKV